MAGQTNKKPADLHSVIAPERPAEAEPGTELLCEAFETGGSVIGKVTGGDERWVRVRIDELNRDWLIPKERVDLARVTWQHVTADYPPSRPSASTWCPCEDSTDHAANGARPWATASPLSYDSAAAALSTTTSFCARLLAR